jgi:hypothetical protein
MPRYRPPQPNNIVAALGNLGPSRARSSFVQAAAAPLPPQARWGEAPKPYAVRQGFTGGLVPGGPMNLANPQTFQPPNFNTPAPTALLRALAPTPAVPAPRAPTSGATPGPTGVSGSSKPGTLLVTGVPVPPVQPVLLPNGAPMYTGPTNLTPAQVAAHVAASGGQVAPPWTDAGWSPSILGVKPNPSSPVNAGGRYAI